MDSFLLRDRFGRTIDYLRISVTDACNFRCLYCLPPEGFPCLPKSDLLSFDEIVRIARIFLEMGGRKLKLTGGEPLLRENLSALVSRLALLPGLEDLGLTTNGYFLETLAPGLAAAGLKRVNVSLDSPNQKRFAELTGSQEWSRVWKGILAALSAGLKVKINVVVLQGFNTDEAEGFGQLAKDHDLEVRFIEFMPLCGTGWHPEWMVPLQTVEAMFRERFHLIPVVRGNATAKIYRLGNGTGRIGFIASMTEPFCSKCSRIRLSADGKIRPCLFSDRETDLRALLRNGADDSALEEKIREAVWQKPAGHQIDPQTAAAGSLPRIRAIGG